jgi:hypothetical protein
MKQTSIGKGEARFDIYNKRRFYSLPQGVQTLLIDLILALILLGIKSEREVTS